MKSDKMPYIIYTDIESLIKKKQTDLPIVQKILQQQKLGSILLVDIQCQQFWYLITQKTKILYIVEKIVCTSFVNLEKNT